MGKPLSDLHPSLNNKPKSIIILKKLGVLSIHLDKIF